MPKLPPVAGGARPVFRPECSPEGPGRSVHSCTWSPRLEALQRPPRSREAVPAPELLLIDAVAPLDFAVLLREPEPDVPMPDPSGLRLRPPAPRRRRTLARGYTAAA